MGVYHPTHAQSRLARSCRLEKKLSPDASFIFDFHYFSVADLRRAGFRNFKKILKDINPFCGTTDALVLDFW